MGEPQRALTLHPEWCPPILSSAPGAKRCENRTWPLPSWAVGKPIALHSGARVAGRCSPGGALRPFSALDLALCGVLAMGEAAEWEEEAQGLDAAGLAARLVPSAIVGVIVFSGCDQKQVTGWDVPDYVDDDGVVRPMWHWRIADVHPLAQPVPCRGALGLWSLPDDVRAAVRAQI